MRKGSKEAKAWGRKMQRLRKKPKLNAEKLEEKLQLENAELPEKVCLLWVENVPILDVKVGNQKVRGIGSTLHFSSIRDWCLVTYSTN